MLQNFARKPEILWRSPAAESGRRTTLGNGPEADSFLFLQRAIGSQAVHNLVEENAEEIDREPSVSANMDHGSNVSRMPASARMRDPDGRITCPVAIKVPRLCPYGGLCNTCPVRINAKLATPASPRVRNPDIEVSMPGDADEEEADRLADTIMRHLKYRTSPPPSAPFVNPQAVRGGEALSAAERDFFEPRFHADFSRVRLHADAASGELADALQARAFTFGNDIAFARGAYQPGSDSGKRLIAHELAHVLQQRDRRNRIRRWTRTGVENVLCPGRDRWVVPKLNSMEVYEFTEIWRHWNTYHKTKTGGKGKFAKHVSYKVKGLANPKAVPPKVWIKKSLSDKNAAATCFHEVTHTGQPKHMLKKHLLQAEYDAWIQTEYFRLRHDAPEGIKGSTFKAGGIKVADVAFLTQKVQKLYQHRDPSSPFIWEWDKEIPSGVKQVTGWSCLAAPKGTPAYYAKPPKAVIRIGAFPKLRKIRTSGSQKGNIYLTTKRLIGGTHVTVLQDTVDRIDYDNTIKPMVEILHHLQNYWIPAGDIRYP